MNPLSIVFVSIVICHVTVIQQSEAKHGFCSINWYGDETCNDLGNACEKKGGTCTYESEGCVCLEEETIDGKTKLLLLKPNGIKEPYEPTVNQV